MKRIMKFPSKKAECGDFRVTKEQGQGYAENNVCYFRTEYVSREKFQKDLDEMCTRCINGELSLRNSR